MCSDTTDVVFLRDEGNDVLAVFPGIASTVGRTDLMTCYAHVGQHGSACFAYCYACDEVTDPEEYADLAAELLGRGYELRVVPKDALDDTSYDAARRLQVAR